MEDFYSVRYKEENWNKVVNAYKDNYSKIDDDLKEEVTLLGLPQDIQIVLLCKLGGYLSQWIHKNVPALGNKKPIDYLKTDDGTRALKAAIMRMPD
jgi:hypothetical protein